ncbi:hypothetical protein KR018_005051 [Drosophila ironensis]|nr:hypothetical protein KR018_005051 [Drosophila ironensis]
MGLRTCSHFAVLAIPLWAVAFYLLVGMPVCSQAASLGIEGADKRSIQDLPSKKETESQQSSFNLADASTLSRFGGRASQRTIGYGPRLQLMSRAVIPIPLDLLMETEVAERMQVKRFDDYGHMRFGKRGGDDNYDDYGHMRFGR